MDSVDYKLQLEQAARNIRSKWQLSKVISLLYEQVKYCVRGSNSLTDIFLAIDEFSKGAFLVLSSLHCI